MNTYFDDVSVNNLIKQVNSGLQSFYNNCNRCGNYWIDIPSAVSFKNDIIVIANSLYKKSKKLGEKLNYYVNQVFFRNGNVCRGYLERIIATLDTLEVLLESDMFTIWDCIHPLIKKASYGLYLDGHYKDACCDAYIEINDRIKKIYKILKPNEKELDGVDLMHKIFSESSPLLLFGEISSETGKNIQVGMRFMLAGAMSAFRNPKAHTNDIEIDKFEAVRRLTFASSLMYHLDEAIKFSNIKE